MSPKAEDVVVRVAIAPRKRAVWRLDPQVVELILDHVFSQGVTNNVAFGTYRMKDSQGAKAYVAKTIRESHNAVIVRQLQTLIMQNFPRKNEKGEDLVPPKRTLFKILALMPATGTYIKLCRAFCFGKWDWRQ